MQICHGKKAQDLTWVGQPLDPSWCFKWLLMLYQPNSQNWREMQKVLKKSRGANNKILNCIWNFMFDKLEIIMMQNLKYISAVGAALKLKFLCANIKEIMILHFLCLTCTSNKGKSFFAYEMPTRINFKILNDSRIRDTILWRSLTRNRDLFCQKYVVDSWDRVRTQTSDIYAQ